MNDKLDLHNTAHVDVEKKVVRFIEDHWDCGRQIEIITGNSNRMKDLVSDVLISYKLDCISDYSVPFIKIEM